MSGPKMDAEFEKAAKLEREGVELCAAGDLEAAIPKFQRMRELVAARAARMRNDPQAMRHVATAMRRISNTRSLVGDDGEALRLAEGALRVCEANHEKEPTNPEIERDLNLSCDLLGDVCRRRGDTTDAIAYLERAVAIARRLMSAPDDDPDRRREDLAGSLERLAWAHENAGEIEVALRIQQEQASIARSLVAEREPARTSIGFLASSLSSMGSTLRELGCLKEARDTLEESLELYRQAYMDCDQGPWELHHRAVAHRRAGKAHASLGDLDRAKSHFSHAISLGRQVLQSAHAADHCRGALRDSLTQLADLFRAQGDLDNASALDREASPLKRAP